MLEASVNTYRIVLLQVQHTHRTSTLMCSCIDVLIIKMIMILCGYSLLILLLAMLTRSSPNG